MGYLNAFWYEYKYDLKRQFSYKFNFFSNTIAFILIYCAIVILNKNTGITNYYHVDPAYDRVLLLIGYTFWQFSSNALGISAIHISGEALSGLLEVKLLSKVNVTLLFFARLISSIVVCLFAQVFVILISIIFGILQLEHILKYCVSLVIYIPSLIGMFGMGLIFGGITIKHKNIGQFMFLVQTGLLAITNVFGMQSQVILYIIPYTLGMDIARRFMVNVHISAVSWILYIGINIIWLILGYTIFNFLLKQNKKRGYFNAY